MLISFIVRPRLALIAISLRLNSRISTRPSSDECAPIHIANDTKHLAKSLGLLPCQTAAYSPESNGMSESFVKRFKQDYVQVNELWSAENVVLEIPKWLNDKNENHPHKGLGMLSPREFLRRSSN